MLIISILYNFVFVRGWSRGCLSLGMVLAMVLTSLMFDMNLRLFGPWSLVTMLQGCEVDIAEVTEEQRLSLPAIARSRVISWSTVAIDWCWCTINWSWSTINWSTMAINWCGSTWAIRY